MKNRHFYKGLIDLSDPEAVAEAVRDLPEEDAKAVLQAAAATLLGVARLRILTELKDLSPGDTDPSTGEPLTEPATALRTGIIYQWEMEEMPWAPPGSDARKELSAVSPVFQAILGVRLIQSGMEALAGRLGEINSDESARGVDSTLKLVSLFEAMMKPVFDTALTWFAERSGARAEARAKSQGVN